MLTPLIKITTQMLNLIAKIDEFKGEWKAIGNLAPERLDALKHVAAIEGIESSTRIEGVKLTDREIELLLSGLDKKSFESRDEENIKRCPTMWKPLTMTAKALALSLRHLLRLTPQRRWNP